MNNYFSFKNIITFLLILSFWFLGGNIFEKYRDWSLSIYLNKENLSKSYLIKNDTTKILSNWKIWFDSNGTDLDFKKLSKLYALIHDNFYSSSGSIDKNTLLDSSIKGLVDWLGDKHTEYMSTQETKSFKDILNWDFEWIGAVIDKNDKGVVIASILKGSPAEKSKMQNGDIIIKANESDLQDLSLSDAISKIKWPKGTNVTLTFLRKGEDKPLMKDIIRDKIQIPSVETKDFTGSYDNIWYISLNIFWENSAKEFKVALDSLNDKDWIILDLRNNWWGYLESAVAILSNFIKNWDTVVTTKFKDSSKNVSLKSSNSWNIYDKPIVILINENSASASEITAWALKDYKKAILVGRKSYWKWSVQEPYTLEDWSLVKITIAKWYTPNDKNIDKEWIVPDVEQKISKENIDANYDSQLNKAKEILSSYTKINDYDKTIENLK